MVTLRNFRTADFPSDSGWEKFGEGQKGTPGRGRDRKCHDRACLSRPLVLSLGPLTSLTSFPLSVLEETSMGVGGGGSDKMGLEGKGHRFFMTLSDVFLPVPFLASPFDLHREVNP